MSTDTCYTEGVKCDCGQSSLLSAVKTLWQDKDKLQAAQQKAVQQRAATSTDSNSATKSRPLSSTVPDVGATAAATVSHISPALPPRRVSGKAPILAATAVASTTKITSKTQQCASKQHRSSGNILNVGTAGTVLRGILSESHSSDDTGADAIALSHASVVTHNVLL